MSPHRTYVDDNFGHWNIESDDDISFYEDVQRRSVEKVCEGCGKTVKILPDYAYCDSCATRLEQGLDLPGRD